MITPRERYLALQDIKAGHTANYVVEKYGCSLEEAQDLARAQKTPSSTVVIPPPQPHRDSADTTDEQVFSAVGPILSRPPTDIDVNTYNTNRRKKLFDRGLDQLDTILDNITNPRDVHYWAMATNILVQGRRLEDGEATQRFEIDDLRTNLQQRFADLNDRGNLDDKPGLRAVK